MMRISGITLVLLALILVSCGVGPEPIVFGEDPCSYCKMTIVDPKFGGELVTDKGKVFKFDALECMVPYLQENKSTPYSHKLGIAYDEPGELKSVDNLVFVFSENYRSPMGGNLAAFNPSADREDGENALDWQKIKNHTFTNHK